MDNGLLIAATQPHGPPHTLVAGVLAVAVVAWLVYRAVAGRKGSEQRFGERRGRHDD